MSCPPTINIRAVAESCHQSSNDDVQAVTIKKRKKTRQCFEPDKKKKVKAVRRLGACLRCRIYKEPVGAHGIVKDIQLIMSVR